MATQKVSVSLGADELKWVKARAKRLKLSVSASLTDILRRYRQQEARREFLASLEPSERASREELEDIRAEWRS
jgi:hypothetical protein